MTKQALKGVTMLALIISIAFITAVVSANAQAPSPIRANVPFEFMVANPR